MQAGRYGEAIALLNEIVAKKPEFAEGWNRRATVHYLAGDLQESIADCDEVLKRNPGHFGALSGLGQIYLQLAGRRQGARLVPPRAGGESQHGRAWR